MAIIPSGIDAGRRRVPASRTLKAGLVIGAFAALVLLERRRPLRRVTEPAGGRDARNLALAAGSALAIGLVERPITAWLAQRVEARRWGLVPHLPLPSWMRLVLALALLDYTLYLWHVLTHRLPALWRFHLVHHVDLDLSASTALRFHFGEMLLSAPWRAAQVLLIGVGPRTLALWQAVTLVEIMFHHANLRLPAGIERRLARIIMTPRLHGIHHSSKREETETNWSSGLTLWDRLYGTLKTDVPQQRITIGVPGYRDPRELALPKLVTMPFGRQRPAWQPEADQARRAGTCGGRP
jgi:sterol desaturase/sphingolipid hydroxylase (fatty acid hydroxylase superfamily)